MPTLNIENAIRKGYQHMNESYSLTASQIYKLQSKPPFDAICDSFALGYYQALKATQKGGK